MPEREPPKEKSWLTETEKLFGQVMHDRFVGMLQRRDVVVHEISESSNSFGEFMFVSISRTQRSNPQMLTFYGLGYHEYREKWIYQTWQFYESHSDPKKLDVLQKPEALRMIAEREAFIRSQDVPTKRSGQAQLYEILAELMDEDGALTEMEDLGWPSLDEDS